jgi:UDP-N-acetylglucosamine diphosphorylase/glucosamine-1-phosphate N-acetyltransferase
MHVVIFEGNRWFSFAPFALGRPVFTLACGISTLLEKQIRATRPTRITFWVRPEMVDYCRRFVVPGLPCPAEVNRPLDGDPALLLAGRSLYLSGYERAEGEGSVVVDDGPDGPVVRLAHVRDPGLSPDDALNRTDRWRRLTDLPQAMPQSRLPAYVWDLIKWNEEAIVADAIDCCSESQPHPRGSYHLVDDDNVWLGRNVILAPGAVLDGSRGPVVLGDGAIVGANAVLTGPVSIGNHAQVAPLAHVRSGTSVGPLCKVGGEVANSVILSHSNKAHEGFLGDSYVGQWVNLGAGTTTSNLKNTYGEVSVAVAGQQVRTGRRFLGAIIGDHVKTGIGTRLMAGSYVGYGSSVAVSGITPRTVPSFTFLTDAGPEPYKLDKAAAVMSQVFGRRGRSWTPEDDAMNRYVAETAKVVEAERA